MNKIVIALLVLARFAAHAQAPVVEIRGPFVLKSKIYPGTERD